MNRAWFDKLTGRREILARQLKDPAARGFWNMVVDKYSDRAHFIYELLQNADDAHASSVRIVLRKGCFDFYHNGSVSFSISDPDDESARSSIGHLNALTSIGASSKNGEDTIGKFGIGFKSVFQYTDVPHIEDDNVSFRIEDYIVPRMEKRIPSDRGVGETYFHLPFRDVSSAYEDIEQKLLALHNPLLFLPNLRRVEWCTESARGIFRMDSRRMAEEGSICWERRLLSVDESGEGGICFQSFSRVLCDSSSRRHKISVAIASDQKNILQATASPEPAYCFFPTTEETGLNFLVHAPFLLTDSRENIKRDSEWNDFLLRELARLLLDGLELMGRKGEVFGRSRCSLFDLIPIRKEVFFRKEKKGGWVPTHLFAPFYLEIEKYISEVALFRTVDTKASERFVGARRTRFASHKAIPALFGDDFFEEWERESGLSHCQWCVDYQRSIEVQTYLRDHNLIASFVTPERVLEFVSVDFLRGQDEDWLRRFYDFLADVPSLFAWGCAARVKSILLCSDGDFHAPFRSLDDPHPVVCLPDSSPLHSDALSCLTVHPSLMQDEGCRRFFSMLGLHCPDSLTEIENLILPKYKEVRGEIDWASIMTHLRYVADYFESTAPLSAERTHLLSLFTDLKIVPCVDASGTRSLERASDVFLANLPMRRFLQGCSGVYYLNNDLIREYVPAEERDRLYAFLQAMGVYTGFPLRSVERIASKEVLRELDLHPKSLRQYDKGAQVIVDRVVVGLEYALANMTFERSVALFDLLNEEVKRQSSYLFRLSLEGEYRYVEKGRQSATDEKIIRTSAKRLLMEGKWLYDRDGALRSPKEIETTDSLSDLYDVSATDLFFFLGIKVSSDLSCLSAEQRKAIAIVNRFKQNGISVERMERILNDVLENPDKYIW